MRALSEREKHLRILEGLADADANRTVPQTEVRAWAKALLTNAKTHTESERVGQTPPAMETSND